MPQAFTHLIWLLKRFDALKAEVNKVVIIEMIKVPTSLNNLKTQIHD